jgi:hypothetical protein
VDSENWLDVIENPLAITNVYSSHPDLSRVRVMRLELDEQGPTLLIRIELPTFPDTPPLRWRRHCYDAAIMELRLFGVSELRIDGWTTDNVGGISLYRNGDSVRFQSLGRGTSVSATGVGADVHRIEGYRRGAADTHLAP